MAVVSAASGLAALATVALGAVLVLAPPTTAEGMLDPEAIVRAARGEAIPVAPVRPASVSDYGAIWMAKLSDEGAGPDGDPPPPPHAVLRLVGSLGGKACLERLSSGQQEWVQVGDRVSPEGYVILAITPHRVRVAFGTAATPMRDEELCDRRESGAR